MIRRIHMVALVALMACLSAMAHAVERIVVLSDSLSDTGNLSTLTGGLLPPPGYFDGRFSNGPVWVDGVAARFGKTVNSVWKPGGSPVPSGPGFIDNYAVAGAFTTTYATTNPFLGVTANVSNAADLQSFLLGGPVSGIPGLPQQFGAYAASGIDTHAEHLIWAGANDIVFSPYLDANAAGVVEFLTSGGTSSAALQAFAASAAQNVVDVTTALVAAGVDDIVVINLPDLSQTPDGSVADPLLQGIGFTDASWMAYVATASQAFNAHLSTQLTGLDVTLFDVAASLQALIDDPAAAGLTNVTDPCLTVAGVCANPDGYLYWDGVHPTTRVHDILAGQLAAAIPLPAPLAMMLGGIVLLLVQRRRKGVA